MIRAIVLNDSDNVATLVDSGKGGESASMKGEGTGMVVLAADTSFGHKVATRLIERGEAIVKYGKVIGQATKAIQIGEHVHVHNVEALRGRGDKNDEGEKL